MSGAGAIAVGVAGGVVLLLAAADLFVTVFNYDGFTFLAGRLHAICWAALRASSRLLRGRARAAYLSLGSAAMLPVTLLSWLALELSGFALMFLPGLAAGDFTSPHGGLLGPQGAFYLSGGDLTSLTFGDLVARTAPYRALVDLETVIGLATFTIGLTYVLAAFDALGSLNSLHGRVRRQAISPNRPASILIRHFRNGRAEQLPDLVQALVQDLAAYDDALRRYPVVFYFHTRRSQRSIPRVYAALGELIELLRWGLPADEEITTDPSVLALEDEYTITGRRLLRSFVGPPPALTQAPLSPHAFAAAYLASADPTVAAAAPLRDDAHPAGADPTVAAFTRLRADAGTAAGRDGGDDPTDPKLYEQYREWVAFHERHQVVVERLRTALCYGEDATDVE